MSIINQDVLDNSTEREKSSIIIMREKILNKLNLVLNEHKDSVLYFDLNDDKIEQIYTIEYLNLITELEIFLEN